MPTAEYNNTKPELRRPEKFAADLARRLAMLLLLCLPAMVFAAALPPDDLAVLVDPAGRETIASVSATASAGRFAQLQGSLNAGYTRDVHWLRFTVPASAAGERWLEVQPSFLDDVRLYEPAGDGFRERRAGDRLPFSVREVPYRAFVFKLAPADGAARTYYLRLQTTSTSLAFVKLWQPDEFLAAAHVEYALIGLSLGIVGVVVLFNLILWAWLRDALHGWFCLHLVFHAALNLGLNGIVSEYFFPDRPQLANLWLNIVVLAGIAAATPFCRRMLRIDARLPVLHALFRGLLVAPVALIPMSLAGYHTEAVRLVMSLVLGATFVALWRSWRLWREGCDEAPLLLLANSLPMLGGLLAVLTALGLYPGDLAALNARQVTGLLYIVTLHFALTIRIKAMRAELHEAGILKTIMEFVPSGVTLFDAEQRMIACNQLFKRLHDFPETLFKDGPPSLQQLAAYNAGRGDYGPGDPDAQVRQAVARVAASQSQVCERSRPDGTVLEMRGTSLPGGRGFVTIYTDVTERVRHQQAIRRVKELMSDAINFSSAYVWETDRAGRYTFLQGAENILGYRESELLGEPRWTSFWLDGEAAAALQATMQAGGAFDAHLIAARSSAGDEVWISSSARAVFDEAGQFAGYRGVDVDVTELTRARQELEQMALHDALTGLANRRKFQLQYEFEVLRQERGGKPLVLLLIDIDRFKQVNDRHGHIAGDACLKIVAEILLGNVRATDLVARFGGEEFVVLLANTSLDEGAAVAEKLRLAVERAVIAAPGVADGLRVTISIGASVKSAAVVQSLDQLIARADAGVYCAKNAGRNRVCLGD